MRVAHVQTAPAPQPLLSRRRSALVRLSAHLRAARIERDLCAGAETWRSPAHAARAVQLSSDRSRWNLARSLDRLIEDSERRQAPFRGAALQPCREQVREALPHILEIGCRLRCGAPVNARGMAMLRQLLCDGAGPCYVRTPRGALASALESVCDMLKVRD